MFFPKVKHVSDVTSWLMWLPAFVANGQTQWTFVSGRVDPVDTSSFLASETWSSLGSALSNEIHDFSFMGLLSNRFMGTLIAKAKCKQCVRANQMRCELVFCQQHSCWHTWPRWQNMKHASTDIVTLVLIDLLVASPPNLAKEVGFTGETGEVETVWHSKPWELDEVRVATNCQQPWIVQIAICY